jgi:Na+/proline symporter
MLLAGLSSALDAGLSAASSLWVTDIVKSETEVEAVTSARNDMAWFTITGLAVSLAAVYLPHFGLQQLWWIFNTIAVCIAVPTILSLYWEKLNEKGGFLGGEYIFSRQFQTYFKFSAQVFKTQFSGTSRASDPVTSTNLSNVSVSDGIYMLTLGVRLGR